MEEEDQEDISKCAKFNNSRGKAREAERQEEAVIMWKSGGKE